MVEIDLPVAHGPDADPYRHAAETLEEWTLAGILIQDRKPTLWALSQQYEGPDGVTRTRNGILARVGVDDYGPGRIRPHERTQPGPKQDRLDLTRATRHNLSPIFSLTTRDAWPHVAAATRATPWAELTDEDGTVHRLWPIDDPAIHAAVGEELREAELLIADGHHRYETARAYRDEVPGEGPQNYTLMALTGLDDPGLTVFPTHRLLTVSPETRTCATTSTAASPRHSRWKKPTSTISTRKDVAASAASGMPTRSTGRRYRLTLKDTAGLDRLMEGRSEAYRHLDAAILEKVVLDGILGMSEADVEAKRGIAYAKGVGAALGALDDGSSQAAFILRATPVEQVRGVAAAGETMPPKSTYFFPKLLSGMVFNPLS